MLMSKQLLMCRPDYFDIEYEINPWMDKSIPVDRALARDQWQKLYDLYQKLGYRIELVRPVEHLPDMVFTANGGLVIDGKVMLPKFRYPERQPETEHFKHWFESAGYETQTPDSDFEGEGDALVCGDLILAGYGFRSDLASHAELDHYFDKTVVSLKLVNPYFYHLDTCLAVLDDHTVAYYPDAFDADSQREIELLVPRTIKAGEQDAMAFGLNAVSDGHNIVMSLAALNLMHQLQELGYHVWPTPLSEFRKSGGGTKCLTLELRH